MEIREHIGFWDPSPVTLPEPTKHHVVIKCVMQDDPRVFRTICVPSNYHFGLIHYLLQYSMGWSNEHLHEFDAFGPYQVYKTGRKGAIKKPGEHLFTMRQTGRSSNGFVDFDDNVSGEEDVHIGDIWNRENDYEFLADHVPEQGRYRGMSGAPMYQEMLANLASLSHKNIYVQYTYDFGEKWVMAIKFDRFEDFPRAFNHALFLDGKGGPPVEHRGGRMEINYHKKQFDLDTFNKIGCNWHQFLAGQIATRSEIDRVVLFEVNHRLHDRPDPSSDGDDGDDDDDDDDDSEYSIVSDDEGVPLDIVRRPNQMAGGKRRRSDNGSGFVQDGQSSRKRIRYEEEADDCGNELSSEEGSSDEDDYHEALQNLDTSRIQTMTSELLELTKQPQFLTNAKVHAAVLAAAAAVTAVSATIEHEKERTARWRTYSHLSETDELDVGETEGDNE